VLVVVVVMVVGRWGWDWGSYVTRLPTSSLSVALPSEAAMCCQQAACLWLFHLRQLCDKAAYKQLVLL